MGNKKTFTCPNCSEFISYRGPYHAGFGDQGFLYCDRDPTILVFDAYNRYYEKIIPDKLPWTLNPRQKRMVEKSLAPCPCGGSFKFRAKPQCPNCQQKLDVLSNPIYYVVIDKEVNGNMRTAWRRRGGS